MIQGIASDVSRVYIHGSFQCILTDSFTSKFCIPKASYYLISDMFLCPISIVVGFSWSMAINAFALPGNIALTPMLHRRFSLTLNQHIFDPPASWASWRAVYHRMVELKDGSLLSSWENYSPEPPLIAAPIWKSDDGGRTFHNFSQVTDQVDNWGMVSYSLLSLKHAC